MKLFVKLAVLFFLLLVAIGIAGYFLVPPAAKKAVDEGSVYAFGEDATVDSIGAKFSLDTTQVGFRGYALESPEGFEENLLRIGEFRVGVGTKSMLGEPKSIGEFVLEDVELTLVQQGLTENNLLPVLNHLRGLGGGGSEDGDTTEREGSPGPRLRIGTLRVEGVKARVIARDIPGLETFDQTFEVPAYEADYSEVMGEEGKTVAEIAGLIVTDLKERALGAAEGHVPAPALSILEKTLDGGLEGGLGGALEAGKDALEGEAQERIDDAKDALEDKTDALQDKAQDAVDKTQKKVDDLLKSGTKDAKKKLEKGIGGLLGGSDG